MSRKTGSSVVNRAILNLLHWFRFLFLVVKCCIPRQSPSALNAPRKQMPKHIALLLHPPENVKGDWEVAVVVSHMVECVRRAAGWCIQADIEILSVYDKTGLLKLHHDKISRSLSQGNTNVPSVRVLDQAQSNLHTNFPMTPPPSDGENSSTSSAVSLSPVISYAISRKPSSTPSTGKGQTSAIPALQVNLICREQGKPALARAAQYLSLKASVIAGNTSLPNHLSNSQTKPPLTVQELNALLEPEFAAPDLLIVHPLLYPRGTFSAASPSTWVTIPSPLELYSFPPWQIRLTEIFYDPLPPDRFLTLLFASMTNFFWSRASLPPSPVITKSEFCRALDEFGKAEMKVGK